MTTDQLLAEYLDAVAAHLEAQGEQRSRLLEEVEGHLRDAAAHHVDTGMEPIDATRRAIQEFGPAADVASGFSGRDDRNDRRHGWKAWATMALPMAVALLALGMAVVNGVAWLSDGTVGRRVVAIRCAELAMISGALAFAAWYVVRHGRNQRAAWIINAAVVVVLALPFLGRT